MEAYLRDPGVTKCPGYGDPEFAQLHILRMRQYDEAPMRKKAAMLAKGIIS